MKTKILSLFLSVAACMGLASCHDDNWTDAVTPDGEGSVSLTSMTVDVDADEALISRADVNVDAFLVDILDKTSGAVKRSYTYGSMPEVVSLPVGDYTVSVRSHNVKDAEWDAPYYVGQEDFAIELGKITEIGTVKCKFSNIKVTVKYTTELAKQMGQENVEKLKAAITDSYVKTRERLHKGAAQKKLLDSLLKMVDFPLPEAMLEADMRTLMTDLAVRLERQGKRLDSLGKTEEELRKELLPQAEEATRSLVLLLAIAKKEGLEVSEQEVLAQIYQNSLRSGQDFKTLQQEYERSGLIFLLRDRLLADKAMDRIYAKAKVKEIPAADAKAEAAPEKAAEAPAAE